MLNCRFILQLFSKCDIAGLYVCITLSCQVITNIREITLNQKKYNKVQVIMTLSQFKSFYVHRFDVLLQFTSKIESVFDGTRFAPT